MRGLGSPAVRLPVALQAAGEGARAVDPEPPDSVTQSLRRQWTSIRSTQRLRSFDVPLARAVPANAGPLRPRGEPAAPGVAIEGTGRATE